LSRGARKRASPVLKGPGHGNVSRLPDMRGVLAELEDAALVTLADKGYQGSTYAKIPYKGKNKPDSQKQANKAHAKLRAPGWVETLGLGTIEQGPLHLWDGGGLARPAPPAWPVAQPAGEAGRPARARHPRDSPVSRLLPRPLSFPWGSARFRR
jgi:hypothetical protein